jgi:NADPH2:quinone reductase
MRAWQARDFGSFRDVLRLVDVPIPADKPGSALVRIIAAGVNFPDTLRIRGKYQVRPPLPFVPGFEMMGIHVETHERVICWTGIGAFQEYVQVPRNQIFPVPPGMSDVEAAALLVSFQTAYFGLVRRARLQAGETLLVTGGAGAVGSSAIQLGKALGATVIAAVGSAEKEAICKRIGADYTLNYRERLIIDAVREIAPRGVDVALDNVGGEVFDQAAKCLAWEGRIVTVGFTSGSIPSVAANRILLKNIAVVGVYWSDYWKHDVAAIHAAQAALETLYGEGKIKPLIGRVFEMEDLPSALDAIEERGNYGKNVLTIAPSQESRGT